MTKAEIVAEIAHKTGVEKIIVLSVLESFMDVTKSTLAKGENLYLRGFGTFGLKRRAEKTGRNILAKTTIIIPAHYTPSFKPSKRFVKVVKNNVKL